MKSFPACCDRANWLTELRIVTILAFIPFALQADTSPEAQDSILSIESWSLYSSNDEIALELEKHEFDNSVISALKKELGKGSGYGSRLNASMTEHEASGSKAVVGYEIQDVFFPFLRKSDRNPKYLVGGGYWKEGKGLPRPRKAFSGDSVNKYEVLRPANMVVAPDGVSRTNAGRQETYSCEDMISMLVDERNHFDLWTFGLRMIASDEDENVEIQFHDEYDIEVLRFLLVNGLVEEAKYFKHNSISNASIEGLEAALLAYLTSDALGEGSEACFPSLALSSSLEVPMQMSGLDGTGIVNRFVRYDRLSNGMKLFLLKDYLHDPASTLNDDVISSSMGDDHSRSSFFFGEESTVSQNSGRVDRITPDASAALAIEGRSSEKEADLWEKTFDTYLENERYFDALRHLELGNILDEDGYTKALTALLAAVSENADILTVVEMMESIPGDVSSLHPGIGELGNRMAKEGFGGMGPMRGTVENTHVQGGGVLEVSEEMTDAMSEWSFLIDPSGLGVASDEGDLILAPLPVSGSTGASTITSLLKPDNEPVSVKAALDAMRASSTVRMQILERLPNKR